MSLAILQLLARICPCAHEEAHMEESVFGTDLVIENSRRNYTENSIVCVCERQREGGREKLPK